MHSEAQALSTTNFQLTTFNFQHSTTLGYHQKFPVEKTQKHFLSDPGIEPENLFIDSRKQLKYI